MIRIDGLEQLKRLFLADQLMNFHPAIYTPASQQVCDVLCVHHELMKKLCVIVVDCTVQILHIARLATVEVWIWWGAAFLNFIHYKFSVWIPLACFIDCRSLWSLLWLLSFLLLLLHCHRTVVIFLDALRRYSGWLERTRVWLSPLLANNSLFWLFFKFFVLFFWLSATFLQL